MLTQDHLKTVLRYNPNSGVWKWRIANKYRRIKPGDLAGHICTHPRNQRRLFIKVDGKGYLASRLAFLYMTGAWPEGIAEHKDQNMLNNKWKNLRDASLSQNGGNRVCVGIRQRENGRFEARLKRKNLGTFDTFKQAQTTYRKAHAELYKEFSPYRRG